MQTRSHILEMGIIMAISLSNECLELNYFYKLLLVIYLLKVCKKEFYYLTLLHSN